MTSMEGRIVRAVEDVKVLTMAQRYVDTSTELHRHPHSILLENLARASAIANALEYQLANADPDDIPGPLIRNYQVAIDTVSRLSKLALDAGVDERKMRAQEADSRRFAAVLMEAVKDPRVDMPETMQDLFLAIVAELMRTEELI